MTAAPAKFTFDLDLTHRPVSATSMSEEALAEIEQQARSAGYAEGFAAGEKAASVAAAQSLAAAANMIAQRAAALIADADKARAEAERDAVALASTVGRKLAASLMAREPSGEIEALLVDCLASLSAVPHLVIRCHPDLAGEIRNLAAARIAQSGFTGRLVVMGEPDITPGDGRIEWAEGGLVRDSAAITADIDRRIAAYLGARGLPLFEETSP
jgi:flagellar assembly protein FliH